MCCVESPLRSGVSILFNWRRSKTLTLFRVFTLESSPNILKLVFSDKFHKIWHSESCPFNEIDNQTHSRTFHDCTVRSCTSPSRWAFVFALQSFNPSFAKLLTRNPKGGDRLQISRSLNATIYRVIYRDRVFLLFTLEVSIFLELDLILLPWV